MTFKSLVTAIADAIREKGGTTEKIKGRDIPDAIRNIKAGLASDDYIIYDYLHSSYGYRADMVTLHGDLTKLKSTDGYGGIAGGANTNKGNSYNPEMFLMQLEKVKKIPDGFWGVDRDSNSNQSYDSTRRIHFIDDEIEEFGEYAFANINVKELWPNGYTKNAIPTTVTVIPRRCFYRTGSLNNLYLHDGITHVGAQAFQGMPSLGSVNGELPTSLQVVGDKAFYGQAIPYTKMPADVKTIGSQAFSSNSVISSIKFLGTPTSIASDAFSSCSNLTNIYVPWSQGAVANAPWGATNATIHYNTAV